MNLHGYQSIRVRSAVLRDTPAEALAWLPAPVGDPSWGLPPRAGRRRAIIPGQRVVLARGYVELP